MTDNEIKKLAKELGDIIKKGISQGFRDIPKTDGMDRNIGDPTAPKYDPDARADYIKKMIDQTKRDEIASIDAKLNIIRNGNLADKAAGKRAIKRLEKQRDNIDNGKGYIDEAKDMAAQSLNKVVGKVGSITKFIEAGVDIFVACQQRLIDLKRAEVEKNAKLTQLGLKQQGSIMSFGMQGITDGFTKNAHEMAFSATQSGYDLAKMMIDTSMQMTIASKTYAKDVLTANTKAWGTVIASSAAIGAAVGALVGGIGAPIGAMVGAAIGLIASSWNKIWGIEIEKQQLNIQIMEKVADMMGQYQDKFKELASGWDKLYKETADLVLKINDAGIKFGVTIGFGSDKFANTMLQLANTNINNGANLVKLFGDEANKIPEYMANYMEASQRNVGLTATDLGNIMGTGRLFGMSGSESANLYGAMNIFNTSVSSAADSMGVMYHQLTRMGLSSKKFGKDLVQNLKLAEKYNFKGGVENMMKMTQWAQQTRFNLNNAASFADSIVNDSLSGALEKSVKLQVLGGNAAMFSDPFGMLYDAGADVGDMAQRMYNMFGDLTGTFNRMTGETEFSWYENKMIAARAQALGMSLEDARNMIRQSNKQGVINDLLAGSDLSEEDKVAIGNRATYNKKNNRWEVVDIKGVAHDINEYKNKTADIEDLLPADTQEAILTVAENSLSHLENLDNYTKTLMARLGMETNGEILERADREGKNKYDAMTNMWDSNLAAFRAAGEHSENMFNAQVTQMQTVANNLGTLKDIYVGVEKQVTELVTTQFEDIKRVAHAFSLGAKSYQEYVTVQVNGIEKDQLANGVFKRIQNDLKRQGADSGEDDVLREARRRYLEGETNILKRNNDGKGNTNGGIITSASNVQSINDGAVNVKTANRDQYLVAQTGGPIDKILQQLIPGLRALVTGNGGNSVQQKPIDIKFDGRIVLDQDGSTINLVEIMQNNPAMAMRFIRVLERAFEANKNGKPNHNYMI